MSMIEAVIFDVFGTLVDWRTGIARECAAVFQMKGIDLDPHEFADAWRAEYQPAMERIRSGNRDYVPLDLLHRENLEIVLERMGLQHRFADAEKASLNHAWEELPPWSDTVDGLTRLKRHFIIAPCSNGSIALMSRLARFAGLPWDAIVGADIAQAYKPSPAAYIKSAQALGCEPDATLMVAAHNSDLFAATDCGLKTAFMPRNREHGPGQTIDLTPEADWDYSAENFLLLVDRIIDGAAG